MILSSLLAAIITSQSPCSEVLTNNAAAEACAAEEHLSLAEAAPKTSTQRVQHFEVGVDHFHKAAAMSATTDQKDRALEGLARLFDDQHLNRPSELEPILRELIALRPTDVGPLFRLAKLQEARGLVDAAEDMLLSARRQQPDLIEPYRMLAQFYARRATALSQAAEAVRTPASTDLVGQPDEHGIYRVGGAVLPPHRLDVPDYPKDAVVAGVQGFVQAEVVVDASGVVTDTRIVKSIPMLDDAALQAVRNWRFTPATVNGQPVPVRMIVTVTFQPPR